MDKRSSLLQTLIKEHKMFYNIGPYLLMYVLSQSFCPWQAFQAWSKSTLAYYKNL